MQSRSKSTFIYIYMYTCMYTYSICIGDRFYAPEICSISCVQTFSKWECFSTCVGVGGRIRIRIKRFGVFARDFTLIQSSRWPSSLMDINTKFNSQCIKGCQVSNALWDGATQLVVIERSAPKYIHTTWVRSNSMFTTYRMNCILLKKIFRRKQSLLLMCIA